MLVEAGLEQKRWLVWTGL